ncbi:MAG: FliB protein, partial [Veillonella dispar DORA_11]
IDSLLFTIEDDDNEFTSEERLTLQNVFELLAFDLDPNLFQYAPNPTKQSFKELLDLYKKTEPIDENWTAQVNTLSSKLDQLTASVQTYIQHEDMSLFNKVYQYILLSLLWHYYLSLYYLNGFALFILSSKDRKS